MNLKKAALITAAAGALGALAVPAMAFENVFNGSYTVKGFVSNFDKGDGKDIAVASWTTANKKANNYFEQRARLKYTAKASDDLKLVTQFELDTRFGGITDGKYNGSSDSGVLDSDGINLETKHVYLDFNVGKTNVIVGVLPYKDAFKGLFIDADVPAIYTTTKLAGLTLGAGYSRFSESQVTGTPTGRLGDLAKDGFMLDTSYALSKDIKAGISYYLIADYQTANKPLVLHTFGANGEAKLGALTVSGFAAMQTGHQKNAIGSQNAYYHGYALNAAAKMPIGIGTVKTSLLFTSGDQKSGDTNVGSWYSPLNSDVESGMMLLVRNYAMGGTSTDDYIKRNISNVALATLGYDAKITAKAFANANLGLAWAPKSNGAPNNNGCDFMGAELNVETGYKVYDNLTAKVQAAYVLLGHYYKDSNAAGNPYTGRVQLSYAF